MRRVVILSALVACTRASPVPDAAPPPEPPPVVAAPRMVEPWENFDAAFEGCAGG